MARFVWLASYPKSGNTWLRLGLARAFLGDDFDPDKAGLVAPIFASPRFFDGIYSPKPSASPLEIKEYWLPAQKRFAELNKKNQFLKTHNAFSTVCGKKYTNENYTIAQIYIIRDPRDVLDSYAHHYKLNPEQAVDHLLDTEAYIQNPRTNFSEILSSWGRHVTSWEQLHARPRLVLRYEDLLRGPDKCFRKVFTFLGLQVSAADLDAIVSDVSFSKMKRHEQESGFREAVAGVPFFRRGETGDRSTMSDASGPSKTGSVKSCGAMAMSPSAPTAARPGSRREGNRRDRRGDERWLPACPCAAIVATILKVARVESLNVSSLQRPSDGSEMAWPLGRRRLLSRCSRHHQAKSLCS